MEYPGAPLLPSTRLFRISPPYRSSYGYPDHLPHLSNRPRDRYGVYHEEDKGIWVLGPDEPVADCDVAEDEVGEGKAGVE